MQGKPLALVENGVLQSWILDTRSARQLGLTSNGRAARGSSSPPAPSPTNLAFQPGSVTPAALMADIKEGLFITEMMGSSINGLTGDYSRGASGFMIRDGQIAEAAEEFTLAGNLLEIFASMTLADDLQFRFGSDAPTLSRCPEPCRGLTLSGETRHREKAFSYACFNRFSDPQHAWWPAGAAC